MAQEVCCFTVGYFWPVAHFCFSNLAPQEACSLLHPLCAWPVLPVYTTTLFIYYFSHFQHNWEIVLGDTLPADKNEPSLLSWKAVTLLEVFIPSGSGGMSPPARLPLFMSSALCSRDSKHFLTCSYGKCDIYKRDHLSACALRLGLCVIWCPWVKSCADTRDVREGASTRKFGATSRMLPHSSHKLYLICHRMHALYLKKKFK